MFQLIETHLNVPVLTPHEVPRTYILITEYEILDSFIVINERAALKI